MVQKYRPQKQSQDPLAQSVKYLKGVGEKISMLLAKKDIFSVRDALYFFPRTYEDRRKISSVRDAPIGMDATVMGKVVRSYPVRFARTKGRRGGHELLLEDLEHPEAKLILKWFHKPYILEKLNPGTRVMVTGKVQVFGARKQIVHPDLEVLGAETEGADIEAAIVPVYSQTEGLFQKSLRKIEAFAVREYSPFLEDPLPKSLREKYSYPDLKTCIREIHLPENNANFDALLKSETAAQKRLIYEEFFIFSLALAQIRKDYVSRKGILFQKPNHSWEVLKSNLGFKFTNAQKQTLKEILDDMCTERVMYRLLQGDVGSGKTAVSAAASLIALESGYQVALMAPTEVLVEQHTKKFESWFQGLPYKVLKLTGSTSQAERKEILKSLSSEEPMVVIGTHALFEDKVQFGKLGFVIVDEQHRFGVRQRAALVAKGENPDLLVMTATPIPRTLALTVYGDLDVSIISELPPGRKPIETKVYSDRQREILVKRVRAELEIGRQAYIVFPLIEESEALAVKSIEAMWPEIERDYAGFKLGILHGKMKSEQKSEVLGRFAKNEISVLVSTTVIEVGVDVPNASVMIVEAAERFGLSQLHQLRGRVGRGSAQSFCFLVNSTWMGESSLKRLRAMEKIHDGFKLSELDLEMRGSGELTGTKQTGIPDFSLGQLPRDLRVFQGARRDAFELLEKDPDLSSHELLKSQLQQKMDNLRRS